MSRSSRASWGKEDALLAAFTEKASDMVSTTGERFGVRSRPFGIRFIRRCIYAGAEAIFWDGGP